MERPVVQMTCLQATRWLLPALLLLWMPFAGPERPLEASVEQERCLATTLWHEARGEPLKAQRAVLDVVLHRAVQSQASVCDVVAKPRQFAWYDGRLKLYDPETQGLLTKVSASPKILKHETFKWFYSGQQPVWAKSMTCRKIGKLHFCKEGNGKASTDSH